ncbi:MAG: hypothetical protein OEN56_14610 [Gemmatimonadota bacterium]|nr:hypothetical protein [Gemmatimonadota bacterium]
MYRSRLGRSLLAVVTALTGCSDGAPTGPARLDVTPDPAIHAPVLTMRDLTLLESVIQPSGQAEGLAAVAVEDDDGTRPLQQVINPRTRAGFDDGYAFAIGQHSYIGNVGLIRTSTHVSFRDQHVGSQTGQRQAYTPFLVDLGQLKDIAVWPKVYTDHTCGLTAQGDSSHKAWWQFYQGRGAPEWGVDEVPSQAAPVAQGSCTNQTGTRTGSEERSGGFICSYFITYDLDTGEIVDAQLLYCSTQGGEVL